MLLHGKLRLPVRLLLEVIHVIVHVCWGLLAIWGGHIVVLRLPVALVVLATVILPLPINTLPHLLLLPLNLLSCRQTHCLPVNPKVITPNFGHLINLLQRHAVKSSEFPFQYLLHTG